MAGVMVLIRMRYQISLKWISVAFILGVAIVIGLTTAFWKSDARWARFIETLPRALYTEQHKAWISTKLEPCPLLSDGQPVDASAYERISLIKEGAKLALEQPLGKGHNRTVFFDVIDSKFNLGGLVRGGQAHSGVVDFAIANGIPGILL